MSTDMNIVVLLIKLVQSQITASDLTDVFSKVRHVMAAGSADGRRPCDYRLVAMAVKWAERLQFGPVSEDVDFELLLSLLATGVKHLADAPAQIRMDPLLRQACDELVSECDPDRNATAPLHLVLSRDRAMVLNVPLHPSGMVYPVTDIGPGHYELSLDTGRMLWEQHLSEGQLLRRKAFPKEPLHLAASTDNKAHVSAPSVSIRVLGGCASLSVYPGPQTGRLELRIAGVQGDTL
jgi:hypothetical protein